MLTAWFYNPASDRQGIVNKVIASIDAPFCHVELQFPDGTACTVYLGSEVVMKQRSFNNACYTAVAIPCTPTQCQAARRVAARLHAERVQCSALDMVSCLVGVPVCPTRTFCSKLVAQILCESGIMPEVPFATVSPSGLYRCLGARPPSRPSRLSRRLSPSALPSALPSLPLSLPPSLAAPEQRPAPLAPIDFLSSPAQPWRV
jgi:hypothetical protein